MRLFTQDSRGRLRLDKEEIVKYFVHNLDIFSSPDLLKTEIADAYLSTIKLENENKSSKQRIPNVLYFTQKIKHRAEEYTPWQDDKQHNKEHPTEPHLNEAFEIIEIKQSELIGVYLTNKNSYASAVHEDLSANHSIGRSSYLLDATLEVSADYSNPYDIYIKITNGELSIFVANAYVKNLDTEYDYTVDKYIKIDGLIGFGGSERVLDRREALATKKLQEKLKTELRDIRIEQEVKKLSMDGFKQIVWANDNITLVKTMDYDAEEEKARNKINEIFNSFNYDYDDLDDIIDDDDDIFR